MLEKVFKLSENKTDAKTEILAGITTFMTMAYILAVNPSILSATGMDSGAVFTATALAAFIGTLLMAIFANYPFALAPGMGLNAYFAYTVVLGMVGTVFAVGPAGLIVTLLGNKGITGLLANPEFWLWIILLYYFIATFISIDKIIGRIYPLFGICLIIMALGVIIGIFTNPNYTIPEIWSHFTNMHPDGKPIWSFMFITVACGAISGFHSTQSPLMARCMKSEKQGHFVFYGAMVAEGVIALIWAAAGCALYKVTGGLNTGLSEVLANGQSAAIYDVCIKTMGSIGVALAMIGVIVCPITSGDTAFRSARLVLADWFKIDQNKMQKRLILCVPLLAVGAFVGHLDYAIVWRYFSWTNQTLAMIVLWTASMYLFREKKNYWITAVPATFMSAVSMTYFFCADECLGFSTAVAYPVGIILAALFLGIFIWATRKPARKQA